MWRRGITRGDPRAWPPFSLRGFPRSQDEREPFGSMSVDDATSCLTSYFRQASPVMFTEQLSPACTGPLPPESYASPARPLRCHVFRRYIVPAIALSFTLAQSLTVALSPAVAPSTVVRVALSFVIAPTNAVALSLALAPSRALEMLLPLPRPLPL